MGIKILIKNDEDAGCGTLSISKVLKGGKLSNDSTTLSIAPKEKISLEVDEGVSLFLHADEKTVRNVFKKTTVKKSSKKKAVAVVTETQDVKPASKKPAAVKKKK